MAAERDGSTGDAWTFAQSHGLLLGTYAAAIFLSASPVVLGAAVVRQDGAPAPRRLAAGVVGGHGVLPGRAARRLCLCASPDQSPAGPRVGHRPCGAHDRRDLCAAAGDRRRLGQAARARRDVLAARAVCGLDRAAVLRAVRQRSAAAGVVRAHRPSGRRRPVFPLRGEQRRQLPRAHLLSVRDRAVHPARRPDAHVVGRLLHADRADRRMRRAAHALAQCAARHRRAAAPRRCARRGRAGRARRAEARCAAELARCGNMGGARRHSVRPADRRHGACVDRRGGLAAPVGDPARPLPSHLRDRVPDRSRSCPIATW